MVRRRSELVGDEAEEQKDSGEVVADQTVDDAPKGHLVPAHVLANVDRQIATFTAESDSRIQGRELRESDKRVLLGDAGEGRTFVDLLGRYDRDRIMHQPRLDDSDRVRQPDFAVAAESDRRKISEIVDSKAWNLLRPTDSGGKPLERDDFYKYLQRNPEPERLMKLAALRETVEKYASSPRLDRDGRVVLYFPEEVHRYAPQLVAEVHGWSHTPLSHGREVEVRSMGVWRDDLWNDVSQREHKQRPALSSGASTPSQESSERRVPRMARWEIDEEDELDELDEIDELPDDEPDELPEPDLRDEVEAFSAEEEVEATEVEWVDQGIENVPIDKIDLRDSPIDGPEDYHKVSYAEMVDGCKRLNRDVRPQVENGADGDSFAESDAEKGLDYEYGDQRIYDAFYGNSAIRLEKIDDTYQVVNGYHRLEVARDLGFTTVPARVIERRYHR